MKTLKKKLSTDTLTTTFTSMRQRLLAMAERITGNRDEAADAVQDAFVRLWKHRDNIGTEQAAAGMSVTAVHNMSIDVVRRRAARPTVAVDEARDMAADDTRPADRDEAYAQVAAIIEHELSPVQRSIVRLREYEGLDFDDIARRLGLQPSNVRVQLSRARKRIREIYRERHQQ